MAFNTKLDLDPADTSIDRYGDGVSGASWTLANTTPGGVGLARIVSILNNDARDDQAITITIVGTDADGKAQTEVIAGPDTSATTVSTKHYLTVTSVTPLSTIGTNTYDIGFNDDMVSKTIPLDSFSDLGAVATISLTGTAGFDVEVTYDLVNDPDFTWTDQSSPVWLNATNVTAKSASLIAVLDQGAQACRIRVNSYTDTAELAVWIAQSRSA